MMMSRIAAIQMVSSDNLPGNLAVAKQCLQQAKQEGAQLAVLPETFAYFGKPQQLLSIKEALAMGPIQQFLAQQAKALSLWIIAGTLPLASEEDDRVYASSLVFNSQGERVARYDKIHLFDVLVSGDNAYRESSYTKPGREVICVDTPVGRVGLSVCYDVRFPELYRQLLQQGAEILVVPSAFTEKTGKVHWEILLSARAIENTCYVVGANQGGEHENGRHTYGHSMIIDPWGGCLASLTQGTGVVTAEIDLSVVSAIRHRFPSVHHRRL